MPISAACCKVEMKFFFISVLTISIISYILRTKKCECSNKWTGKIIRIGHLGDFNDPMLIATLSAVEMGLALSEIDHHSGGVTAAMNYLKNK